jgi:hypothetical protein
MLHSVSARLIAALLLCTGNSWCASSYVTSVPDARHVRVTAARMTFSVGESTTIVGEAYDCEGEIINHRRRIVRFVARDTTVVTVVGSGSATLAARAPGATWVVGESGGKRDSVRITVTP